jgi:hypothetical protein
MPCVPITGASSRRTSSPIHGVGHVGAAHRALLSSTKWPHRASKPNGGWGGTQPQQGDGCPTHVLRGGCGDGRLHPQSIDVQGSSGRMSYELWTSSTPSVQHLCTFGRVAHV